MINTEKKIYSVSEINRHVKEVLDNTFSAHIMIEAEISQMQKSQLGHIYITLKDEKSSVKCTLWNTRAKNLAIAPAVGLKALIKCKVSFYEKTGSYQLDIIEISAATTGEFHELFEKLKLKLKSEGLFEKKFKKTLPKYPRSISIITSLTGSVIQDILKIIKRRLPFIEIEIYGCNVQGMGCADSIIKQLITINKKNIADIIIIARGGGSLEDLIGYNNEILARQIYNSSIPTITAIGHETDTTIADLVSDIRAATPSEAAEISTRESAEDMLNNVNNYVNNVNKTSQVLINNLKSNLRECKNNIDKNNPVNKINNYSQTIDIFYETIKSKLLKNILLEREKINLMNIKLKNINPVNQITELESKLINRKESLHNTLKNIITNKRNILKLKNNTIKDISPLNILRKGYSLVYSNGKIANQTADFEINGELKIKVVDGEIHSSVRKIKKN